MPYLRDPSLELFARELAAALNDLVPPSDAAVKAGRLAGYEVGRSAKTFAANCRKRSQRADVRARIAELNAPGLKRAEEAIGITAEYLLAKLDNLTDYNIADYLDAEGHVVLNLAELPRAVVARLSELTQETTGGKRKILRTKLKGYSVIDGIRLMAQIKGLMAPEKKELKLLPTDQMTDDELARIAAGGSGGATPAPANP